MVQLPPSARQNYPERISAALRPYRQSGLLPSFPFGSDFTATEQRLIPALQVLQEVQRTPLRLPGLLWQGFTREVDAADRECLARLGDPDYPAFSLHCSNHNAFRGRVELPMRNCAQ